MKSFTLNLKEEYTFLQGGTLQAIIEAMPYDGNPTDWKRPAVIVVPGGGYGNVSAREAEPVATAFLARGFHTFILKYLCAPQGVRYPEQLLELASAVDCVRKNAEEWNVNPDEIFVVGFSAGGHLTANLAVEYPVVSQKAGVELNCKPTAVGLGYPVISKVNGHQGSYINLLQGYSEEEQAELLKTLNLNEAVSETTAPAFLWATAEDGAVPVDNTIRYAQALSERGIAFEVHIYPKGNHGLSTCNHENNVITPYLRRTSRWVDDCAAFFRLYIKEDF